nr:glycoprotein-N-acetylgalactosamine 3-beta-galactosyltransferase 1-like [Penaeus vannamei]
MRIRTPVSTIHIRDTGAGHVMGREAVRRFVELAIPNHTICKPERSKGEDVGMGNCLQKVGIKMGDTRDHIGQGRFWQRHPAKVLSRPLDRTRHSYYPISQDSSIRPKELYLMDYLIYKIRVFGHIPALPLKPALPPDLSVVPEETIQKYKKYDHQSQSPAVTESTTETTESETTE